MDWVNGLPPGGDKSYNSSLAIVVSLINNPILFPFQKDDTAIDTTLLMWNRVVSLTGIFTNIISERDPKFILALWTNIHQLFGNMLSFSTSCHPQTHSLAESMIQTLEDMVRMVCAYGLELKDCVGFTHDLCTLLPALEPVYRKSIHAITNQTFAIL
ncbi:hypothetical protein O181_010006 [Austropuccinia psidii MF-1]|uniref:Uncharacterized protein n=1 Tax=Austropuccinia psidii MF-1 TaxID=1389203 RepID=A0A9Q3GK02_9BASI|nr:hypothetical protein [Austropuccinia psidii MF-1]